MVLYQASNVPCGLENGGIMVVSTSLLVCWDFCLRMYVFFHITVYFLWFMGYKNIYIHVI